jgi:hypothetical protein
MIRHRIIRRFALSLGLLVLVYLVLALAQAGGESSCHWVFPKWFGCVLTKNETLAAGLVGTAGALAAAWIAWTAVQQQIAAERARADEARSEAKRENERRQAEQVSGWMEGFPPGEDVANGGMQVKLIMVNASNQLVYNLIASVVTAGGGFGGNLDYRNFLGRIPPGRTEYGIKHPGHGMHKRYAIELAFEDAAGRSWVRRAKGGLEQIRQDPLSFYDIAPPVGWRMP